MGQEIAFTFEATPSFVELRFPDGTILRIDRAVAEKDIGRTTADHAALDMLAYNDPFAYIQLFLRGDPETYLRKITDCHPLDN